MEGLRTHTWPKSHNYSLQVVHTPTQMEAHIKSPLLTPHATFGNQSVLLLVIGNCILLNHFQSNIFGVCTAVQISFVNFFSNKILTSDQQASCSSNTHNLYLGGTWFESMPGHHLCRSFHYFP
jgi:hypothetical protein